MTYVLFTTLSASRHHKISTSKLLKCLKVWRNSTRRLCLCTASCTDDAYLNFAKEIRKQSVECIKCTDDEKIRWTTLQRHRCIMLDNQNAATNPIALEEISESGRRLAIKQDWLDALPTLDHIRPDAHLQDISQLVDEESPIFEIESDHWPAASVVANSCVFESGIFHQDLWLTLVSVLRIYLFEVWLLQVASTWRNHTRL